MEFIRDLIMRLFGQLPDSLKLVVFIVFVAVVVLILVKQLADRRKHRELKNEMKQLRDQRNELQQRLDTLDSVEGHVWRRPDSLSRNTFIPKETRRARFIAICNLKGGTGKTTMTINLGTCLAQRGKRVLLVDLDFQGSLSNYLLSSEDLKEIREQKGLTTKRLLDENATFEMLNNCIHRVKDIENCFGVVSWEKLEDIEYSLQARYFVNKNKDLEVRFLLQRLLHSSVITEDRGFDYVLFDCPPRLTTACINGLTCSDHVLVPAALSDADIEAVPRTLTWLHNLNQILRAQFLGVVISRCSLRGGNLVKAEVGKLNSLERQIAAKIPGGNHVFDAKIPDRAEIRRSKRLGRPIVLDAHDAAEWFGNVCEEMIRRIYR